MLVEAGLKCGAKSKRPRFKNVYLLKYPDFPTMVKDNQANYSEFIKWVYLCLPVLHIGTENHGVSVGYHCVVSVCVLVPLATPQWKQCTAGQQLQAHTESKGVEMETRPPGIIT